MIAKRPDALKTSIHPAPVTSPTESEWHEMADGAIVRVDHVPPVRRWGTLPGSLSWRETKRRFWHMGPGFLPVASYIFPHKDPLSPTFQAIALGIMVVVTSALFWRYRTIRRSATDMPLSAVFGYAWSVVLTLLLFPARAELAMLVLAVLAFGDGMATTCGMIFRGPRLPWNLHKTWAGFVAFVAFGGGASSLAYAMEAQPAAMWSQALMCGFMTAAVAAVAESIPSRINDNVRVGVAASVAAVAVQAASIGL